MRTRLHTDTPDDVLIEAIAAASLRGDSPELRIIMCLKLREAILNANDAAISQLTAIKSVQE